METKNSQPEVSELKKSLVKLHGVMRDLDPVNVPITLDEYKEEEYPKVIEWAADMLSTLGSRLSAASAMMYHADWLVNDLLYRMYPEIDRDKYTTSNLGITLPEPLINMGGVENYILPMPTVDFDGDRLVLLIKDFQKLPGGWSDGPKGCVLASVLKASATTVSNMTFSLHVTSVDEGFEKFMSDQDYGMDVLEDHLKTSKSANTHNICCATF